MNNQTNKINENYNDESLMLFNDCNGYSSGLIMENKNGHGPLKFKGPFQKSNEVNKNKRMYEHSTLEKNRINLMEAVNNRGLVGELDHMCLTTNDFRVLTVDGWKEFKEIRVGDYVYSRVEGQMIPSRVNAIVDKPYDGEVYHVKGRSIDCKFTPNHKFLLTKRQDYKKNKNKQFYETVETIHNNRKTYLNHFIPKIATWEGKSQNLFTIPGIEAESKIKDYSQPLIFDTLKFSAFLGIYLAEGYISKKDNRVFICQSNEYGKVLIKKLLDELHPDLQWSDCKNGFYTNDARLRNYLIPLGNKYTKYIPQEIKQLSSKYLEELIFWFAIGNGDIRYCNYHTNISFNKKLDESIFDGNRLNLNDYESMTVYTVSRALIRDIHECVVKAGFSGTLTIRQKGDRMIGDRIIKGENTQPLYNLHINKSKNICLNPNYFKITQTYHTGRIYCLSTEHGNFYMEHKGKSFWTGNSDSIIHLERASHLITNLWWDGNVLMGEAEILPTPNGQVLKMLIESGCRVGISSRGVGTGKVNGEGIFVIGENYKLITFDVVADPSTAGAYQKLIDNKSKNKNENFEEKEKNNLEFDKNIKNESNSLYNFNENSFSAYVRQLVRCNIDKQKNKF